jgi:hypothetical protein
MQSPEGQIPPGLTSLGKRIGQLAAHLKACSPESRKLFCFPELLELLLNPNFVLPNRFSDQQSAPAFQQRTAPAPQNFRGRRAVSVTVK